VPSKLANEGGKFLRAKKINKNVVATKKEFILSL
jgi:hypothetical protein